MRIGLDIDNVVSDFDKKILTEFMREDKNKRNRGIVNPNGHWIKDCFDWSKEEIEDFFHKNMEKFASELEVREKAVEYMSKLMNDGYEIYLISHRVYPHYVSPFKTTTDWLIKNKIPYTKLVLSETTNKTKECLENNIKIMFDDSKSNCYQLVENNILCYLVRTDYNYKVHDGLEIVNNWEEIYQKIREVCE